MPTTREAVMPFRLDNIDRLIHDARENVHCLDWTRLMLAARELDAAADQCRLLADELRDGQVRER